MPLARLFTLCCCLLMTLHTQAAESFSSDRLTVEVVGQGPDVIFIPGLASSREVWRPLAKRLAADHRLHLVQLSGFAGQPWQHGDGPLLEPAMQELDRYIRESQLQQPKLIGHSLGGLMALRLAQAHPGDVGAVMTVDSLPFYSALFFPGVTVEQARPVADRAAAEILSLEPKIFAERQAAVAQALTHDPATRRAIVDWSLASDRQAMATALHEAMITDARQGLAAMTTPVTAVYADAGREPAQVDALWEQGYRDLPGVKRVRIERSLHFIMSDQPQAFDKAVDEFLRQP